MIFPILLLTIDRPIDRDAPVPPPLPAPTPNAAPTASPQIELSDVDTMDSAPPISRVDPLT